MPFSAVIFKTVALLSFVKVKALFCILYTGENEMCDNKKQMCVDLLTSMYARILARGEVRYPKRGDFTDKEVCAIKAHLGPWPRALEIAGIKPPREDNIKEKTKEKRINARRRKRGMQISDDNGTVAKTNEGEK